LLFFIFDQAAFQLLSEVEGVSERCHVGIGPLRGVSRFFR
jgi:hypothetical protein